MNKFPSFKAVQVPVPSNLRLGALTEGPSTRRRPRVHIKYGFGGMRRLDLEAGTNSEGKVKFAGLPDRVQRPPLEFHASKDDFMGTGLFDPSTECQAKREIAMEKSKAPDGH